MRKLVGTIVSVVVVLGGVVLRLPWLALDVAGRVLTMFDAPGKTDQLINWLAAHPWLAWDIGPWVLMTAGLLSLMVIHAPVVFRGATWLTRSDRGAESKPACRFLGVGRAASDTDCRLQLLTGIGYPFIVVEGNGVANRITASIMLENTGQKRITNCKVYIEDISSDLKTVPTSMLTLMAFNLDEAERKVIRIAFLDLIHVGDDEPGEIIPKRYKMRLCQPRDPCFGGASVAVPFGNYTATLRIYSAELNPIAVSIRICGKLIPTHVPALFGGEISVERLES
jgi:hypothetical protein